MKKDVVLIGGGGHAKVIIDILRYSSQYNIVGICDKNSEGVEGVPVIGTDEMLPYLHTQGVKEAFICIGANQKRRWELYQQLKQLGYSLPVLKHPNCIVAENVQIGEGTCIMPGAIINSGAKIGEMVIVNTGSIIEHDCVIEENSHISPRTCLCGGVSVGAHTHIGAGSVVNPSVSIGKNVVVGSGSVVIDGVRDEVTVIGVPAKEKK
ncbi:MAG: acetyltransferase [Cellulosilyticaceae bacterium]